jgi:siroheme synthase (precorrin-2 oxidase/ferrochelatase)
VALWLPVALRLEGRRCLVVGRNEDAAARARTLGEAGASVLHAREFVPADLEGTWLVVLTEREPELAERMQRECDARRIFFCAVDEPKVGSFAHLALARAGTVTAAIGTNGEAPALARRLRELLQELFDRAGLAAFAARHAELRRATASERRRDVLGDDVRDVRLEGELVLPDAGTPPRRA